MRRNKHWYENARNTAVILAALVALAYGVTHCVAYSQRLFSFEGGVFGIKVAIAIGHGMLAAMAIWGGVLMLTVGLAPESWLLNSATGQTWMKRSGLSQTSTVGLRLISLFMAVVAIGIVVLCVQVLLLSLSSSPSQ